MAVGIIIMDETETEETEERREERPLFETDVKSFEVRLDYAKDDAIRHIENGDVQKAALALLEIAEYKRAIGELLYQRDRLNHE